jgi:hypothetical protein
MGHFANQAEFGIYRIRFCSNCIHLEGGLCPVLVAHMNDANDGSRLESILNLLIPRDEQGHNLQCRMFVPRRVDGQEPAPEPPDQTTLSRPDTDGTDRVLTVD